MRCNTFRAAMLDIRGMEATDINKLITSHNPEFFNIELLQLELCFTNQEEDRDCSIKISKKQNLSYKHISTVKCLAKLKKKKRLPIASIFCERWLEI